MPELQFVLTRAEKPTAAFAPESSRRAREATTGAPRPSYYNGQPVGVGAVSQRLIPRGERSGSLTRIATMANALRCARRWKADGVYGIGISDSQRPAVGCIAWL